MIPNHAVSFRILPGGNLPAEKGMAEIMSDLEIASGSAEGFLRSLPFSREDATAGSENELQTVVMGSHERVDLPIQIQNSNFYENIRRHAASGDASAALVESLDQFVKENADGVWENSWVRFPLACLHPYTRKILDRDLLEDKACRSGPNRKDAKRFFTTEEEKTYLRVPVSYLLKLALAESVSGCEDTAQARTTAEGIMSCFISDNSSPETHSFHPVSGDRKMNAGKKVAKETAKRFLLSQILLLYANRRFQLLENGQQVRMYFSPNPHLRQRRLNDLISDSFYRELFMSPCLSGWDRGEHKHRYMSLCHKVLSRSQLNAVKKLKEAGIITNNLVVLPNISNISLANNGTHLSIGSRKLSDSLRNPRGFGEAEEKRLGDLAIKIKEHFLPLFVGTYTAAPCRFDFQDFHPEKVLGFLPHELDYTHVRMLWRRWKRKADVKFFGNPLTPFGPEWLDRWISRVLFLKGDFIPDVRLIDYLVALLSTVRSPGLNGCLGNEVALKEDLAAMGVFDTKMPVYLPFRLRQFSAIGFSGFEGRHYSLFESIGNDFGAAAMLQHLVTLLAQKYIFQETVTHRHIPDDPGIESERRQIFFGTAIGIPTFYVWKQSRNRFLMKILAHARNTRNSHRYPGYLRVYNDAYRRALIEVIKQDGRDVIEHLDCGPVIADLEARINEPKVFSVSHRLTRGILQEAGVRSPLALSAADFSLAAESYYRGTLRRKQMIESFDDAAADLADLDRWEQWRAGTYNRPLLRLLDGKQVGDFLKTIKEDLLDETLPVDRLECLIQLLLLSIHRDQAAI